MASHSLATRTHMPRSGRHVLEGTDHEVLSRVDTALRIEAAVQEAGVGLSSPDKVDAAV